MLDRLEFINRNIDRTGQIEGLDGFEQQAFNLVLGDAKDAFDVKKESAKTRARYGGALANSSCSPAACAGRRWICESELWRRHAQQHRPQPQEPLAANGSGHLRPH